MKELIKTTEHNGHRAISARDLHNFLESKRDFSTWIKNKIKKYGFIENQDFQVFDKFGENSDGGRPAKEYILSIDMAKELSMVECSERGKQARQYFIEMEKQARQPKDHIMTLDFDKPEDKKPYKMLVDEKEKELLNLIKQYLHYGDMNSIAKNIGESARSVMNVCSGSASNSSKNELILKALHAKALFNKEQKVKDLILMINSLK